MSSNKVGQAVLTHLGPGGFAGAHSKGSVSKGRIVKTGIAVLDEVKTLPVRLGEVVEIVGSNHSGKTQLLHLIAAHALSDKNIKACTKVCWFDLNGGLNLPRLRQIIGLAAQRHQHCREEPIANLSGLKVYHPENTSALCAVLCKLPEFLQSADGAGVDTIIIDSLGSFHYVDKQDAGGTKDKPDGSPSALSNELILVRVVSDILRHRRTVVYVSTCALFGEEKLSASWPFPEAGTPSIPADFMPSMWRSIVSHTLLIYHIQSNEEEDATCSRRAIVSLAPKHGSNSQKLMVHAAGTIVIENEGISTRMLKSKMSIQAFQKLISEFPLLVPLDIEMTAYTGFIMIRGKEFRVSLTSDCSRFDADANLKKILKPHAKLLDNRLHAAADPHDFFVEVRDVTERAMAREENTTQLVYEDLPTATFYDRLLTELSDIGWDSVAAMGQSMRVLDLKVTDSANRCHVIGITLPTDYPQHPPRCVTSLPRPFQLQWNREKTLTAVLQQFRQAVEKYQDFFLVMEDFDNRTWVLEPEHPTWRDTYRRISLGKHCSARIEVDPRSPIKGFPECRFLGSESAVGRFKLRLNENMHVWDTSGNTLPRENMQRILEVQFPLRKIGGGADDEVMSTECGICYAYRLDDRVPDIACDLPECAKPYHRDCLLEWLRVLPDTRESFGTVTGKCVYCDQTISISVKDA